MNIQKKYDLKKSKMYENMLGNIFEFTFRLCIR